MKNILDKTLNDSSTMWSGVSGMFGALTISEWCLLITAVVTVFNFVKNWYIDMRKLKMLEEEHQLKLEKKNGSE
jgi:hypothetical protein